MINANRIAHYQLIANRATRESLVSVGSREEAMARLEMFHAIFEPKTILELIDELLLAHRDVDIIRDEWNNTEVAYEKLAKTLSDVTEASKAIEVLP